MGALIPHARCEPIDIPECNHLFEMGEAILAAAYSGLAEFELPASSPCAASLDVVISLGQPAADLCDVLFGWVTQYGPSQRDRDIQTAAAGGDLLAPTWIATWQIELWEAAYPTVEKDGVSRISLPSPAHLHEVNRLVYAHGVAMFHAVLAANTDGTLWPDGARGCEKVSVTNLAPLAPQGGCAGWVFQVTGPVPTFV